MRIRPHTNVSKLNLYIYLRSRVVKYSNIKNNHVYTILLNQLIKGSTYQHIKKKSIFLFFSHRLTELITSPMSRNKEKKTSNWRQCEIVSLHWIVLN